VRQLDLGGRAVSAVLPLELGELVWLGDAVEPQAGHLVVRRTLAREARDPAADGDEEAGPGALAPRRVGRGDPLDPTRELGVAEESAHAGGSLEAARRYTP
jgi:hypothetical protein